MRPDPLDTTYYHGIVVLTGAGVSVASGLRPFRGPGGLWDEVDLMEYATADVLREEPARVWRFFAPLREQSKRARPNPAHEALAKFEARLTDYQSFTLVTQNVDGLHQRAGSLTRVGSFPSAATRPALERSEPSRGQTGERFA